MCVFYSVRNARNGFDGIGQNLSQGANILHGGTLGFWVILFFFSGGSPAQFFDFIEFDCLTRMTRIFR